MFIVEVRILHVMRNSCPQSQDKSLDHVTSEKTTCQRYSVSFPLLTLRILCAHFFLESRISELRGSFSTNVGSNHIYTFRGSQKIKNYWKIFKTRKVVNQNVLEKIFFVALEKNVFRFRRDFALDFLVYLQIDVLPNHLLYSTRHLNSKLHSKIHTISRSLSPIHDLWTLM